MARSRIQAARVSGRNVQRELGWSGAEAQRKFHREEMGFIGDMTRKAKAQSRKADRAGTAEAHRQAASAYRTLAVQGAHRGLHPRQYEVHAERHQRAATAAHVAHPQTRITAPAQTGAKGGKFVLTASGKKRYIKK